MTQESRVDPTENKRGAGESMRQDSVLMFFKQTPGGDRQEHPAGPLYDRGMPGRGHRAARVV